MYPLLLVLLIVVILVGLPSWNLHPYGYFPSGIVTVILVIVVILVLFGRL